MTRRTTLALGIVIAVLVSLGALAGWGNRADGDSADSRAGTTVTAVTQGTLASTLQLSGSVDFSDTITVQSLGNGTITELAADGEILTRGDVMFSVDRSSTVLLKGEVPMYRDLRVGVAKGPDVRQLEENLVELGYGEHLTVDDNFTAATGRAVRAWEKAMGRPVVDSRVVRGEVYFSAYDLHVISSSADLGQATAAGQELLNVSTDQKVVTATIEKRLRGRVKVSDRATIRSDSGQEWNATVIRLQTHSPGTQDAAGSTSDDSLKLTLRFDDAPEVDLGSVTVHVEQEVRPDVLTVPVQALVALASGGYAVEPDQPVDGQRYLRVDVGLANEDTVEISGPGITQGLEVVMPE